MLGRRGIKRIKAGARQDNSFDLSRFTNAFRIAGPTCIDESFQIMPFIIANNIRLRHFHACKKKSWGFFPYPVHV